MKTYKCLQKNYVTIVASTNTMPDRMQHKLRLSFINNFVSYEYPNI